jgi:hypothetical protein
MLLPGFQERYTKGRNSVSVLYFLVYPHVYLLLKEKMIFKTIALLILAVFLAIAQSPDETTQQFESSCTIHIKAVAYQPDPMDQTGKARVYVTLCTREGKPIPFQEIQLVATDGTFSCKPLDIEDTGVVETSIQNCNATDSTGKIMAYLANIPFNIKGTVTASCEYSTMSVRASCTYLITRRSVAYQKKPASKKNKK